MWPRRSSRQRKSPCSERTTVAGSDGGDAAIRDGCYESPVNRCICLQYCGLNVKPHGRLGPLRLEKLALLPRVAYRRDGLSRPFRELEAPGEFILGGASHLDAFSGYRHLPSLPGAAPGGTAGTRAGSPTRSSRTRVRTPQFSNAHDGYRPNCLTTF